MNQDEAITVSQALLLQAASLAGVTVTTAALDRIRNMVSDGFMNVEEERRKEAASNLTRYIAVLLFRSEFDSRIDKMSTTDQAIRMTDDEVCPVYPFN